MEPVIGIDLGTTNSEVAYVLDGNATVMEAGDGGIMPSCVGVNDAGGILVGTEALNRMVVAPERTVLSVKRRMGTDEKIKLGRLTFSPQEISAFILKALKERAETGTGLSIAKAVITVPAYFTDDQRQATREAGELAGLSVVRIINEPTAAALAYESLQPETRKVLVFDLGGGTFDVSLVRIEDGVVEVLSSTGDNRLGGDDFDLKILDRLLGHLKAQSGFDPGKDPAVRARLLRAAESAKIALSSAPFVTVEEDHLGKVDGRDIHLSMELSRNEFEEMIEEELSRTMESVSRALEEANTLASEVDRVILVGGSTRIPMISRMLEEKTGRAPHGEIDPDLCVAMGAAIQAGREMGLAQSGVLVDITPYTFGTSALGEVNGMPSPTQFIPLIHKNTKLPARRSEVFYTTSHNQEIVNVEVYQGEEPDALDNIKLGSYRFELTPAPAGSEIVLHYDLDLNGILKIKAEERKTGKSINAVIENALPRLTGADLKKKQKRIEKMWPDKPPGETPSEGDAPETLLPPEIADLIARSEEKFSEAAEEDREDMAHLIEKIREAAGEGRSEDIEALREELEDILFFIG